MIDKAELGALFEGLRASVTIADPHRTSKGIEHVFVNGTAVVSGGAHTGARPGRALRKA
jgi:N-acyl-D-amino-acid deacylase